MVARFQSASSKNEDWKINLSPGPRILPKFQSASSKNEDWKSSFVGANHHPLKDFKAHPRKMRIERSYDLGKSSYNRIFQSASSKNEDWKFDHLPLFAILFGLFQSASSKNEDWKSCGTAAHGKILPISKRILEKWGLKVPFCQIAPGCDKISKRILEKWGLKADVQSTPTVATPDFKAHPRKMRIERLNALQFPPLVFQFQSASSKNEDWKLSSPSLGKRTHSYFKAHPRKMRIESQSRLPDRNFPARFQSASSKNEDWKATTPLMQSMQNRQFQSASSKNEDWKYVVAILFVASGVNFKAHPRKMRIESESVADAIPTPKIISKRILEKWGLKDHNIKHVEGAPCYFKAHPRKMRIERLLVSWFHLTCTTNFKAHPRKMRIERSLFLTCLKNSARFQSASSKNEDWKMS